MESQVSSHEMSNSNLPENVITSEQRNKNGNGLLGHVKNRKASLMLYVNLARQNFEKITCRVQSKNKDQVRHYYYRLVRRMNKLLGPQLYLDAKNSKDTNSAMLRWWSLLEKHSCKASKLHLKPRRFKIFLQTLEHQLLKDRKKNTRKRAFHNGEKENKCNIDFATSSKKSGLLSGDKKLHSDPPLLTKLKLQLFPLNESIRKALEAEDHNPHLELTLSFRKKISSVLEHMNRKWGSCTISSSGELTLVPYHGQNLNLKWTQGSDLTTGDVYSAVGSPVIFRLRYGWFAGPHKTSSVFEWADSFTNCNPLPPGTQGHSFSCDSFDAAIAAHIRKNRYFGDNAVEPTVDSSIWNAEDTRDAFACKEMREKDSPIEKVAEADDNVFAKDSHTLTDVYWPESLGGLEVEATSCRYQSNEVILSESVGGGFGFSRILSNSLDAFQNFSFFGC
ncbi:hypothetical protein LXL04_012708 [Taraxacum kok-saghyz]